MLSTMIEQGRKWINVNMLRFISVTLSKRLHFPGKSQCSITGKLFLEQALAQLMPASTRLMTAEYMSTECEGVLKETLSNMCPSFVKSVFHWMMPFAKLVLPICATHLHTTGLIWTDPV